LPFTGFGDWTEQRYTYLPALPFVAYVVCATVALVKALPRRAATAAAALAVVAVSAALVLAPLRTRDQQAAFAAEAANYEQMVNSVRNLCGEMPPDSFVYVVGAPYSDLWRVHTPAALNLYYHRVRGAALPELPELAVFIEDKCVLEYDAETRGYVRTD
jgi:hypothetical protein